MDLLVKAPTALEPHAASRGMPPETPLAMPAQDLRYRPYRPEHHWIPAAVLYARFILITVTLGITT
jgi:hypothetical protein